MRRRPGFPLMIEALRLCGAAALACSVGASHAADDRFDRATADSKNGFAVAGDAQYRKECGSCHFAYLPGLLPAQSWQLVMDSLKSHYGEALNIPAATTSDITAYLKTNAADVSEFAGSKIIMQRIRPESPPRRVTDVPHIRSYHRVMVETIAVNAKIKPRGFTNCNDCHRRAENGSFALDELAIPGLTRLTR
jgi:hypothetical protein